MGHGMGKGMRFAAGGYGPYAADFGKIMHMWKSQWENWMPYDLEESDTEYIVTVPLPSYDVKNIEVSVKDKSILIEARKELEKKEEKEKTRKIVGFDFLWNRPHLVIEIPVKNAIETDNVKAKLSKGILKIRFKKIPGKKIDVEAEPEE